MPGRITFYTAPGCSPCQDIKKAIESGDVRIEGAAVAPSDVDIVDLSTDEGYLLIEKLGLEAIPSVYYDGDRCGLLIDDEDGQVVIRCGAGAGSSSPEE